MDQGTLALSRAAPYWFHQDVNLDAVLRALPPNPRVVTSGNHAVQWQPLKESDAAPDE